MFDELSLPRTGVAGVVLGANGEVVAHNDAAASGKGESVRGAVLGDAELAGRIGIGHIADHVGVAAHEQLAESLHGPFDDHIAVHGNRIVNHDGVIVGPNENQIAVVLSVGAEAVQSAVGGDGKLVAGVGVAIRDTVGDAALDGSADLAGVEEELNGARSRCS